MTFGTKGIVWPEIEMLVLSTKIGAARYVCGAVGRDAGRAWPKTAMQWAMPRATSQSTNTTRPTSDEMGDEAALPPANPRKDEV